MNLLTFKAEHPDLVNQLRAEFDEEHKAKASTDVDKAVAEAVGKSRADMLALAGIALGEDAQKALAALADTGLTPEKAKAMQEAGLLSTAAAPGQSDAEARSKALEAIGKAGADTVEAGKKPDAAKQQHESLVSGMVQGLQGGN